jgi:hypothetical protein
VAEEGAACDTTIVPPNTEAHCIMIGRRLSQERGQSIEQAQPKAGEQQAQYVELGATFEVGDAWHESESGRSDTCVSAACRLTKASARNNGMGMM